MSEYKFNEPIRVRKLELKNRVFLAPLAGVSDIPMRRICQELGAGLTYVEMLSSTAISYRSKRTFEMMARHKSEDILGVQVTGSNAQDMTKACEVLDMKGFDTIDINMGCPVRKVVQSGCGSGILKEPERITETITCMRKQTEKPLTAKIRIGYTREDVNVKNTVHRIIQSGADMFTIHGRTRSENYSHPVDFEKIREGIAVKKMFPQNISENVVSVGNGDIFCYESARKMQNETGCNAVMISRGALGNPWIFQQILNQKTAHPTFEEWQDVVLRHIDYHADHYGNTQLAATLLRKHLLWYAKGFPFMKGLRDRLNKIETIPLAKNIIKEFSRQVPKNFVRFEGHIPNDFQHKYDPKYEMHRQLDRGSYEESPVLS